MDSTPNSILQICGITLIIFLLSVYPSYRFGDWYYVKGVTFGYFLSLLSILFSFLSIQKAFQKSIKAFYLIVLGGMILRLAGFAGAIFLIWHFDLAKLSLFIASFMVFYLIQQYLEIRFINRMLLKKTS